MKLGGQTITVINLGEPTSHDGVGDPIYASPTLTTVPNCSVQEAHTSRDISTTDVATARYLLLAPTGVPLTSASVVMMGTVTSWPLADDDKTPVYLVDGIPAVWADFSGQPHHIECYIRGQVG